MIFFTLQGDDAVSFFPIEKNWIAGEKMTYVSSDKNGLLVLAASSATDTVFAFNGETGDAISTFHVGDTPKGVKIRPDKILHLWQMKDPSLLPSLISY